MTTWLRGAADTLASTDAPRASENDDNSENDGEDEYGGIRHTGGRVPFVDRFNEKPIQRTNE